jgi:hypothetical protein
MTVGKGAWNELMDLVPDKRGGLNGSTQHSGRTHLALKTKAKIAGWVRSVGTLPWLGFDRVLPNRWVLPEKHCRINALDGVSANSKECGLRQMPETFLVRNS